MNKLLLAVLFAFTYSSATVVVSSGNAEITSIATTGDTVMIRKIDSCWLAAGNSWTGKLIDSGKVAIYGTLTQGYGPALTRGTEPKFYIYGDAVINMAGDSVIGGNPSTWELSGSTGHPISIYSNGNGAFYNYYGCSMDADYANFSNMKGTYFGHLNAQRNSFRNCTFINCETQTLKTSGTASGIVDTIVACRYILAVTPGGSGYMITNTNIVGGYIYIDSSSFQCLGSTVANIYSNPITAIVKNSVFRRVHAANFDTLVNNIFWKGGATTLGGKRWDSCMIIDTSGNPNIWVSPTSGTVICNDNIIVRPFYQTHIANGTLLSHASGNPNISMNRNIMIDKWSCPILFPSSTWSGIYNINNFTCIINSQGYTQDGLIKDGSGTFDGEFNVRNWLVTPTYNAAPVSFIYFITATPNNIDYMEGNDLFPSDTVLIHNMVYDPAKTIGVDSIAGKYNFSKKPMYSDTSRRLGTWGIRVAGLSDLGTPYKNDSATIDYLLGMTGYRTKDAIDWVRAGFSPMDTTFSTHGIDGMLCGAVSPIHGVRAGKSYDKTGSGATVPCTLSTAIDSGIVYIDTVTHSGSTWGNCYAGTMANHGTAIQASITLAHEATQYDYRTRMVNNQSATDTLPLDTVTTTGESCTPPTCVYPVRLDTCFKSDTITPTVTNSPDSISWTGTAPSFIILTKIGANIGRMTVYTDSPLVKTYFPVTVYKNGCSNVNSGCTISVSHRPVNIVSVIPDSGHYADTLTVKAWGVGDQKDSLNILISDTVQTVVSCTGDSTFKFIIVVHDTGLCTLAITMHSKAISDSSSDTLIDAFRLLGDSIVTYTVTYDGNTSTSGTVPVDAGEYAEDSLVTVLGNTGSLAKIGYTFNNWNTAANGSGTPYSPAATFAMGAANVTIYAQWTIKQFSVIVTSQSHGTASGSDTVDTNTAVPLTVTPNYGYNSSWELTSGAGVFNGDSTTFTPTANSTLMANFIRRKVKCSAYSR